MYPTITETVPCLYPIPQIGHRCLTRWVLPQHYGLAHMSRTHWLDELIHDKGHSWGKRVLYVGGLPDRVSDCELRGIFTSYGLVARGIRSQI